MPSLIRRSPSNLSRPGGITSPISIGPNIPKLSDIVSGAEQKTAGLPANVVPTPEILKPVAEPQSALSGLEFTTGGAPSNFSFKSPGRTDFKNYTPTANEINVLSPQNIIGGQYITVQNVKSDFQTSEITVAYSVGRPASTSKPKPEPMSNKVVTSSNAAAFSRLLGRQVTAGTRLSIADVQRINTPGAAYASTGPSRGFTGGQGYGQLFPVSDQAFAIAQAAVNQERLKSLALKAGMKVKVSDRDAARIKFTEVNFPTKIRR
jgi:hypothetical protein